jgi:hypothetical protein
VSDQIILKAADDARTRNALRRLIELWKTARTRPDALVDSGLLMIPSTGYRIGERGELIDSHNAGLIPFRRNPAQRYMHDLRLKRLREGNPLSATIVKARSMGVSYDIWVEMFCRLITTSNISCVYVGQSEAQNKRSVRDAFTRLHSNMEFVRSVIALSPNNADMVGFIAEYPEDEILSAFNVLSRLAICEPTPGSIDNVRGDSLRPLIIHIDERDYQDRPDAVDAALQSVWAKEKPGAQWWETSTINEGGAGVFVSEHQEAWKAQGECNFWEPGFKDGQHPKTAIFFGAFMDPRACRARLAPGVTWRDFKHAITDEYEQRVLSVATAYNMSLGMSPRAAEERALAHIAFRWGKIPKFRPYAKDYVDLVFAGGDNEKSEQSLKLGWPCFPEDVYRRAASSAVIPERYIRAIRETSVRPPVWTGDIEASPHDAKVLRLVADEYGPLRIWKWPHQITGIPTFSVDPHAGAGDNAELDNPDRYDFTFGCSFDINGEGNDQILEYETLSPTHITRHQIYNILRFLAYGEAFASVDTEAQFISVPFVCDPRRIAFYNQERNAGEWLVDHIVQTCMYPRTRLYRNRPDATSVLANVFGTENKPGMKAKMADLLLGSIASSFENPSTGNVRTIRSARLVDQLSYFERKVTKTGRVMYEARTKGKHNETSKDDGVIALALDLLSWELMRFLKLIDEDGRPRGAVQGTSTERPQRRQQTAQEIIERRDTWLQV